MKKGFMSAIMAIALLASTAVMAQDAKKDAPKAKTEKSTCTKEKKDTEKKSCCSKETKDKK
ncbi:MULTISPECIES: hypothetical protein [unclassified Dysgonomonas]|uniref:hypothetical protein n=1 Tax=unclassified Dysgonomonas TaxID=2630389 RepID=UPI0013EA3FF9|nr:MULTISPECIES: hypothetical protein [unclassified Dysgonomonas]